MPLQPLDINKEGATTPPRCRQDRGSAQPACSAEPTAEAPTREEASVMS